MPSNRKPYLRVARPGEGSYISEFSLAQEAIEEALGPESGGSEGDEVHLRLVYLTDEELEALPEFEGW